MRGAARGGVNLAVILGRLGRQESRIQEKRQIVNGDDIGRARFVRRNKIGTVKHVQWMRQHFYAQREPFKTMMTGRPEFAALHVGRFHQPHCIFAALEQNIFVFRIKGGESVGQAKNVLPDAGSTVKNKTRVNSNSHKGARQKGRTFRDELPCAQRGWLS